MEINIYSNYKVTIKSAWCYTSDEDSIPPDDIAYRCDMGESDQEMNGGELIDLIIKKLKDDWISEFRIKKDKNKLVFEYFNPNNGESSTDEIVIKEIKKVVD